MIRQRKPKQLELEESIIYLVSNLLFAAGSILFLPEVYSGSAASAITRARAAAASGASMTQRSSGSQDDAQS